MADASGAGGIIPATATAVKRFGMGQWGAFLFLFPPCCSWVRLSATRVAIKKAPTVSAFGVFPSLRGDSYLNKPPLRFGDDDEYRRVFEKVRIQMRVGIAKWNWLQAAPTCFRNTGLSAARNAGTENQPETP